MIRAAVLALVAAVIFAVAIIVTSCAGTDPAAGIYGAERLRCVQVEDAAPANADRARECIRRVDARYGQDGGLR